MQAGFICCIALNPAICPLDYEEAGLIIDDDSEFSLLIVDDDK